MPPTKDQDGKLQHELSVGTAVFSPGGFRVVNASDDKSAQVWDVATGEPLGFSLRHPDKVHSAAFSRDGARIVTTSGDNSVRIWTAPPSAPNIIATACKMLGSNHDTADLSERYGVEIKDSICTPNAPAPEPSLMTEH